MLEEAVNGCCGVSSTGGFPEGFKEAIAILLCCQVQSRQHLRVSSHSLYGGTLSLQSSYEFSFYFKKL